MKEKFNSFSPFLQAVMLFLVGTVSFILISIIITLVVTTMYPNMPVDNISLQLKAFPVQYMFINFFPFQMGFLLTPGVVYSILTRDSEKVINKPKFPTVIWSFLLFASAFFLLPFFGEINIEIIKYLGAYKDLMAEKEISDEQLRGLVGEIGSTSFYSSLLIIGVFTGVSEEFAFRKFLFQHMLINTKKLTLSLFSSAFIFALLHFNYIQMLPLFSFGLVLGMMYYVSGSIIPGIVMHAANNVLNVYWLANDSFPSWMSEIDLKTTIPATLLLLGLMVFQFRKSEEIANK
jgi:membrane protease YdiL (CAAX protease family)